MTVLADQLGLEWCKACGRLLTLSYPDAECTREYCPPRIETEEEYEQEVLELSGPAHNKGTESGWH